MISFDLYRIIRGDGLVFEAFCLRCHWRDIIAVLSEDVVLKDLMCANCGHKGFIIDGGQPYARSIFLERFTDLC